MPALAYVDDGQVRLVSRRGRCVTAQYPDSAKIQLLARTVQLGLPQPDQRQTCLVLHYATLSNMPIERVVVVEDQTGLRFRV